MWSRLVMCYGANVACCKVTRRMVVEIKIGVTFLNNYKTTIGASFKRGMHLIYCSKVLFLPVARTME
jgi:hypothetical protein